MDGRVGGDPGRDLREALVGEQQGGLGVRHQRLELGRGEPPVQWHEDRTGADRRELEHQHLGAVARKARDPRAAAWPQRLREPAGGAIDVTIERGIGPAPAALQIGASGRAGLHPGIGRDRIDFRRDHLCPRKLNRRSIRIRNL